MELLSISTSGKNKKSAGFTLIEVLLVIALTILVFGFSASIGLDAFRRNNLMTEESTLVSILQKARSQAMNNINDAKHGFYFDGADYIIFEGDFYGSDHSMDFKIQKNSSITISGLSEIVFDQLTGNASPAGDIILNDNISSTTVSVNREGRINW